MLFIIYTEGLLRSIIQPFLLVVGQSADDLQLWNTGAADCQSLADSLSTVIFQAIIPWTCAYTQMLQIPFLLVQQMIR